MELNTSAKNKTIEFLSMGSDLKLNNENLNHRFRTVFINNNKEKFFIEIGINEVNINDPRQTHAKYKGNYVFRLDHLFRNEFGHSNIDPDYAHFERGILSFASKENIISFLNKELNCSFEDLIITDNLVIDYKKRTDYKLTKTEG
jgi:hypothetical protein